MIVNIIKGIIKPYNKPIEIIKTFGDENEIATISFLNKYLKSKYKKDYQLYDSRNIEENKRLFKALLYSYNIDAEQFEGTIEIYEYN